MEKVGRLAAAVGLCLVVGFGGSLATTPNIDTWYAGLVKPGFTPPSWVFGPVWTALYILMGVAWGLVWTSSAKQKLKSEGAKYFLIQLGLNWLWSVAFFGLRSPWLGMVVILGLWLAIALTVKKCYVVSRAAMWLMVPYLLWVSFAMVLNWQILRLNS